MTGRRAATWAECRERLKKPAAVRTDVELFDAKRLDQEKRTAEHHTLLARNRPNSKRRIPRTPGAMGAAEGLPNVPTPTLSEAESPGLRTYHDIMWQLVCGFAQSHAAQPWLNTSFTDAQVVTDDDARSPAACVKVQPRFSPY